MPVRIFIFLIGLIFETQLLFTQEIRFEHFSTKLGLSNNAINCICQDKTGFIWIGTEDGLNKFDGYSFTVFKNRENDSSSLSDNMVKQIFEDSGGRLWIATNDGGLNLFNPKTETFRRFVTDTEYPYSLLNNNIVQIFEDSQKNIWVMCSNAGINLYQPKSDNFKRVPLPINGITREPSAKLMLEDNDNNLWIAGNRGLVFYNPKTGNIRKFLPFPNIKDDLSNRIGTLISITDTVFLVAVNNSIFYFDRISERFTQIKNELGEYMQKYQVLSVTKDNEILWFATYNGGLVKYNLKTCKLNNYLHQNCDPASISTNIVNSVFKDRAGSFWVGTYLGGINKFEPSQKFQPKLTDQIVTSFFDEPENVWIGTQTNGLFQYSKHTGEYINCANTLFNNTLSYNSITSIYKDSRGYLWLGTWEHGLNKSRFPVTKSNQIQFNRLLENESILCITPDNNKGLWLGTNNNLIYYNETTDSFIKFGNNASLPASFGYVSIQGIVCDSLGNLWVATWDGLHCILLPEDVEPEPSNIKVISYYYEPGNPNSISDSRVLCVSSPRKGTIWIGTYARGINRINFDPKNPAKYTTTRYSTDNGLPSNCVFGIQEDSKGCVWISTNKGFASLEPANGVFEVYDKNDGIQGDDFQWRSSFKASDGTLYFGGSNGFTSFVPQNIELNQTIPPVVITRVLVYNKEAKIGSPGSPLKSSIATSEKIEVKYNQSMLTFHFAALNYILSYKNQYKYRMEGFDKDWIYAGKQPTATYTNLNPGEYTFRVLASNNDGVWNEEGASLVVRILPPWWKTWWFRTFDIVFILVLAYSIYYFRVNNLKKQRYKLSVMVDEKTTEIQKQKEELETMNEELSATNEELFNQRENLENTLKSLKETQKQLIQSEKMASLGVMASGIAHEINNPLNFINSGVIGIENYLDDTSVEHSDEIRPLLEGIQVGVDRAAEIVRSLNRFSHQSNSLTEKCDLHVIINNCLVIVNSQLFNRIEIEKDYTNIPFTLLANEGKLHQLVINLLNNAIDAISGKGRISIKTVTENKQVKLEISDTGKGIEKEHLDKIFDLFYTTKEPGKGTGLGLSIVYDIVKELKGTINIQSESGAGTQVILSLPIE